MGDRTPTAATAHLAAALLEGIRTGRPPHLLLMHLALQMPDEAAARAALASAVEQAAPPDVAALAAVAALWARRPDAFALVRDVLAKAGHDDVPPDPGTAVAGWRATFDALAREQPEAGVALYSLADPALLAAASREIIDALLGWGDLRDGATVLDLGCGIGRLAAPLSASADFIIGVDVSQVMLAEARRRAGAGSRLGLACLSGLDLAALSDAAFDLVLAVDVFPYLMQAGGGLAERHLLEISRVLKPGGRLVLANVSYRGDDDADVRDASAWAAEARLLPLASAQRPFALWDGLVFRYQRPFRDP